MSEDTKTAVAAAAGKYLTFALAAEEYGLPVLKVREIIKMMDVTGVPQVPAHIKGVINLRGRVIPVIDLRLKFALPLSEYTEHTCIIVVEVEIGGRRVMLGTIVDRVSEVLSIAADEIEPTPDFGEHLSTDYMRGIAKIRGTVKILLDLDRVLATDTVFAQAA
ncbi:MAG: purine-binding chemotaxis protein CheW [Acidobacteria bacterium]|nr:purine-binding chemotaxis protein CheW [Acidobacteriota bacterium]